VVKEILAAGVNVDKVFSRTTALIEAIKKNNMQIVQILLRGRADVNFSQAALCVASSHADFDIFELILNASVSANASKDGLMRALDNCIVKNDV
jgi:ankyrin repeat protein